MSTIVTRQGTGGLPSSDNDAEEVRTKLSLLKTRLRSGDISKSGDSVPPVTVRRVSARPRQKLSPTPSPTPPPSSSPSPSQNYPPQSSDGETLGGSGTMGLSEFEEAPSGPPQECPHCGRTFNNPVTFGKHVKSCKTANKRRGAFDPSSQRLSEIEETHGPVPKTIIKDKKSKRKQNFMAESEAFRAMIKAARATDPEEQAQAQAVLAALPPDPSKVECPQCGRKFNAESAERHINVCARVFKPKAGAGGGSKAPGAKAASSKAKAKGKAAGGKK